MRSLYPVHSPAKCHFIAGLTGAIVWYMKQPSLEQCRLLLTFLSCNITVLNPPHHCPDRHLVVLFFRRFPSSKIRPTTFKDILTSNYPLYFMNLSPISYIVQPWKYYLRGSTSMVQPSPTDVQNQAHPVPLGQRFHPKCSKTFTPFNLIQLRK